MATNTTATATTHTGNGSTNNFAISFSFLANNEVDVTVAGVLKTLDTHYTISGSTVTFTSGNTPANGAAVKFQRDTNISAKKVDFQDGSVLTETDLDTNSDQVLFAQQEITDKLSGIEEGATGDQTAAEIRTLVESASDSNVFTDADHTKLNGIETAATADQTAAEIRTLVESASDSNVFTDADHTKLNGIETNATADQTASEIKTLLASSPLDASHLAANSVDSSELVDGSIDTSHLSSDCVTTAKIADDAILSAKIASGAVTESRLGADSVTNAKIANNAVSSSELANNAVITDKIADNAVTAAKIVANAVTTDKIADAELTTLAGMQSGTASKLADSTALTSDIADLNQLDGMAKQTTITDDDTKFPTSGAVVDFVAAQLAPIGGLEVIATDAAFPNTQPASGVVISIADAGGLVVNSSGTSTTARTVGGSTVTINNFASNFNSSTVDAGVAIMVSSTGAGNIYNYHKATLKEADLLSLSNDINDFAARYRVTAGEPTSNNDEGDLIYDKNADKMKVFDSSTNAFKEVTSVGDFKFLFLCPNGGSGSPTINGSIATYDLREGSNTGAAASVTSAAQLLVSINGVVQKPNTGTSAPSEGFAMVDSNTIIFGSNLPTGAEVFVIQIGSAVSLQVPADNTVATAKLQNGSVTTAKIVDDAVTSAKIASGAVNTSELADGGITSAKLSNNSVNADKIAANSVNTSELVDGGITTAKIANSQITNAKIADDAVDTAQINNNGVTNSKIVDGAVTTAKIADGAVTEAKLASNSVNTAELIDGSISTAKIANNQVTSSKIANGAVNTAQLTDGGISTAKIANNQVTTSKIADGAITAAKFASGVGGKILQVVSAIKTDTFTTTSTSFVAITGLSVNITPSSTSSKILVDFSVDGSNSSGGAASARVTVFKDGSNYFGNNIGNRARSWQLANYGDANTGENVAFQFLDSPSTTSQITYDLRIAAQASTATVNRSGSDNDNVSYGYRSASSITVMEVAA